VQRPIRQSLVSIAMAAALLVGGALASKSEAKASVRHSYNRRQAEQLLNSTILWNATVLWNSTILWNNAAHGHVTAPQAAAAPPKPIQKKQAPEAHLAAPRRQVTLRLPQAAPRVPVPRPAPAASVQGSGRCGGNLPSCSVLKCESGGNIRAENPTSTASGKWQIINGTWAGYKGYPTAASAPESVQDERAAQILQSGGRSQWVCR